MGNIIKVQLLEGDKVVREEITENFVTDQAKLVGQYYQSLISTLPNAQNNPSSMGFNTSYPRITLWNNTTNFDSNLFPLYNNGALGIPASCIGTSTTGAAGAAGSFIPSALTGGKGSITYTWEWGTTQGNGTYKAIGFSGLALDNHFAYTRYMYTAAHLNIPGLGTGAKQTYLGYRVSGSDTIFYYRVWESTSNNIVAIKETDDTTVETLSLNITGGLAGTSYVGGYTNDTVLSNDSFYTLTAITGTNLTFKKATRAGLTYGSTFNVAYTTVGTGTHYIESITADPTHIYVLVNAGTNTKAMLVTIDTTTDTTTSVVDVTSKIGYSSASNWPNSKNICKCPFIADNLYVVSGYNSADCPTVHKFLLSTTVYVQNTYTWYFNGGSGYVDHVYMKDNNGGLYFKHSNSVASASSVNTQGIFFSTNGSSYHTSIFKTWGIANDIISYAEFSSPITKTSAQALRIQYTMNANI